MIRLLLKTHNVTGQKYLCKTERDNWKDYPGSGPKWRKHLEEHGYDFSTQLLFECEDDKEFKCEARKISYALNVVKSSQFENEIHEVGTGGDTVSYRMWITNGSDEKYILKTDNIPEGWKKGRSSKSCVFLNPEFQSKLSLRIDRTSEKYKASRKESARKTVLNRDHSKCELKGDRNPAKRPEVRAKIAEAQKAYWQRKRELKAKINE